MSLLKPYTTLGVGIVIGLFVAPRVLSKLNVNLPGA